MEDEPMAGRPRKMAEKVTRLEDEAVRLMHHLWVTMPLYYRDRRDLTDPVSRGWYWTLDATEQATLAIAHLGDMLREKAGITEPGPAELYWSDAPQKTPTDAPETEGNESETPPAVPADEGESGG